MANNLQQKQQPFRVLMAEDSEIDVELFKAAIKNSETQFQLEVVENGEELIRYLKKEDPYSQKNAPHIILLDINMPRMNGIEALKIIKHDDDLKIIPVIMLTCSSREEDIRACYANYANSYIQKPFSITEFIKIINNFSQFWFSAATLPQV